MNAPSLFVEPREASLWPPKDLASFSEAERLRQFGDEVDALKTSIFQVVGQEDVRYVQRLQRLSRACEVTGRVLLHVSVEPLGFFGGTLLLFLHKQLQTTEIGHTALHGAYDQLPSASRFHSIGFRWDTPIDEASWRYGHNVRHHGSTNVAGRDPDIHFGPVRLTEHTPYAPKHRFQFPIAVLVFFPNFTMFMNWQFTGLVDAYFGNDIETKFDFLVDDSRASRHEAWRRALRKFVPYYFKNYVFYPALAGPFFGKVLLGNWMAETMRDLYTAATIYCGHVGHDVASYPVGTRAGGRGEWYAMQVQSTNNFEVSLPVSVLCGGLDRQIEHHLFPTLPPPRLRQIAPKVRALCEKYGVPYKTDTWPRTLKKALDHIRALSSEEGDRSVPHAPSSDGPAPSR